MKLPSLPLALSIAALLLTSARAQTPQYSLLRLGLTDGLFTDPSGYQSSTAVAMEGGIVAGTSEIKITTTLGGGGGLGGGIVIGPGGGSLTMVEVGHNPWLANVATGVTTRLGLWSAEFTRTDGLQRGTLLGFSGGVAAGQAIRFSGSSGLGEASWIANAATGQSYRIGFYDANYTFVDGSQDTHVQYVQGGYAAGYSSIAVGGSGNAAWVADSIGDTRRAGLHGAGFQTDLGQQSSSVMGLHGGTVIGNSNAYSLDGLTSAGQAAWMTNAATGMTTRLGFTGAGYTRSDNTQLSVAQYVKDGYVSGWSGTSGVGIEQWVVPTSSSTGVGIRVGLRGGIYTASDGTELTYADLLSDGNIAGQSYLYYGGASYAGHAAWVSSAATDTTRRIGFFDTAPYVRNDGLQYSLTAHLSDKYVTGYSRTYSGGTQVGAAAWVAPVAAGDAVRVGLFDALYTKADGGQSTTIDYLKGEYVAGTSSRFSGIFTVGRTAWVADAATGDTTELGLTDAPHTNSDGVQWSNVLKLTATGYVAGTTNVYVAGSYAGQTAWIWDANTSTFDDIIFSISSFTGTGDSYITQLFDNGLAIGQYLLYDNDGVSLGVRPFAWTPTDGQIDLTNAVPGGISAAGWTLLTTAGLADPVTGAIIGSGRVPLNSASQGVFVATPTPEPGTTVLLALGAFGLAGRRRRAAR